MSDTYDLSRLRSEIRRQFCIQEADAVAALQARLADYDRAAVSRSAADLIGAVRRQHPKPDLFQAFLHEYSLNSSEGILLMGIAEALLRIPDAATQQQFLQDKLAGADWAKHLFHSDSWLINIASGALALGADFEQFIRHHQAAPNMLSRMLAKLGEPLIRAAIAEGMHIMARHFVLAETIDAALEQAAANPDDRYSFDMLGEAALTTADADRYFAAYCAAIDALAGQAGQSLFENPGISIKLSALYPRYEPLQRDYAIPALAQRLLQLARQARAANISLTVDAEEVERLDMSLDIFARVGDDPALAGWDGLGLAVQAYQKRAPAIIDWLAALAAHQRRLIPVRLVKGAYWDSEIKRAQEQGWADYPLYTRKAATDLSYLACARALLAKPSAFYPQFATHNAHSVAAIRQLAVGHPGYEFQRLHGMGEALYASLRNLDEPVVPCRVYAPVGSYRDLLPYLVRRLLENGANSSFVHQLENPAIAIERLAQDPTDALAEAPDVGLPSPPNLFGAERRNSLGLNLSDPEPLRDIEQALIDFRNAPRQARPQLAVETAMGLARRVCSPFDQHLYLGEVIDASDAQIQTALETADNAFPAWNQRPVAERADCLSRAADLFEQHRLELAALCIHEGGRCLRDALAEVREMVDLCRYYAASGNRLFVPAPLPGPVGEANHWLLTGRGVFVCISPWNFPLAIFAGQIAAALVAGNSVIAKPAAQTNLCAGAVVELFYQAGVPRTVLQSLPGDGSRIGRMLLSDARVAGVAFTGSVATARAINRQLSQRPGSIASLIAETGGQNALIADSSAHDEQLVNDVLQSAFNSAGQRCSGLRVLFLPEVSADRIIERLIGAMQLLRIGSPLDLATDIGPVIDTNALQALQAHLQTMQTQGRLLYQVPLPADLKAGHFFPPTLLEIPALAVLPDEVFGPILHIVRYPAAGLADVVAQINASGYGLTLGLHTRIQATMDFVCRRARVGNVYINRNTIGAVVGVQPFGGLGLSGTGPKSGGPHYLLRFAAEQTFTSNLTAMGGNPWLLAR